MSTPKSQGTLRIGLVQMAASPRQDDRADERKAPGERLESNLERAIEGCREAASRGARILCLQELFRSSYFCQTEDDSRFDLAEPVDGESVTRFRALARELEVVCVVPFFERRAAGVYHNSAAVIDADGRLLGLYRKNHIPDDPGFLEKFYFTPGDLGYPTFATRYGCVGVLICWDQWFPEAARLTALAGAEIIFYPTAIGWLPEEREELGEAQRDAWRTVQRSHAISNGVFVAAVNRVGFEPQPSAADGIDFWGGSFVCDPGGRVLAEAGSDEEVLVVSCSLGDVEASRRGWPFLRDRRIETYGGLTSRYLDARPLAGGDVPASS